MIFIDRLCVPSTGRTHITQNNTLLHHHGYERTLWGVSCPSSDFRETLYFLVLRVSDSQTKTTSRYLLLLYGLFSQISGDR